MDSEFEETSLSKPVAQLSLLERARPSFIKIARWGLLATTVIALGFGLRYAQIHLGDWSASWQDLRPKLRQDPISTPGIRESALPSIPGGLLIETLPADAILYLNEAQTDLKTPVNLNNLKVGDYKVGLLKDGYKFWEQIVRVGEGDYKTLKIKLQANLGFLEVRSAPNGALVFINDEDVGLTPYRQNSIAPNTVLKVRVEKDGFESYEEETKVFAGRTAVVNAPLKKLPRQKKNLSPP